MIPLPAYIDPEAWAAFAQMRKKMGQKVPFTDYAATLILKKLIQLKAEGYDPNACLEQSIERGWRSVFATPQKAPTAASFTRNDWLEQEAQRRAALESPEAKARAEAARRAAMQKLRPRPA